MEMGRETKKMFRMLLPWNDEKEEKWLEEEARAGWHLRKVGCFGGYTFERGPAAEVAYRLDFGPSARRDRSEYFGLFRDAGWEHVGRRGLWQFFRKPAAGGEVPEIYTDPASRIAKYQRIAAFLGVFAAVMVTQVGSSVTRTAGRSASGFLDAILVLQVLLMAVFVYGIVRLTRVVNRLKKQRKLAG